MVEVTLTNEQKVRATIAPVTLKGKPVEIDGAATWQVATGDCTLAEISEDGKSATIVTGDAPGTSEVVVSADADLGEGVETISDVITVTVQGAKAASLGLTLGTPELK